MSKSAAQTLKPTARRAKVRGIDDPNHLLGRIWDMSAALNSGDELTPAMRQEIHDAVWYLHAILREERDKQTRGRPKEREVWDAIHIAEDLYREYVISFEAAVGAALSPNSEKTVDSVLRTYRDWKKKRPRTGPSVEVCDLGADQINQALARLPKGTKKRK